MGTDLKGESFWGNFETVFGREEPQTPESTTRGNLAKIWRVYEAASPLVGVILSGARLALEIDAQRFAEILAIFVDRPQRGQFLGKF